MVKSAGRNRRQAKGLGIWDQDRRHAIITDANSSFAVVVMIAWDGDHLSIALPFVADAGKSEWPMNSWFAARYQALLEMPHATSQFSRKRAAAFDSETIRSGFALSEPRNGAEGGSRTRTSLRTTDFKYVGSAIA